MEVGRQLYEHLSFISARVATVGTSRTWARRQCLCMCEKLKKMRFEVLNSNAWCLESGEWYSSQQTLTKAERSITFFSTVPPSCVV